MGWDLGSGLVIFFISNTDGVLFYFCTPQLLVTVKVHFVEKISINIVQNIFLFILQKKKVLKVLNSMAMSTFTFSDLPC